MKLTCADVITAITGNLTIPVNRMYVLYNGLTGDHLFTHQIPRAFRACRGHVRSQVPLAMAQYLGTNESAISAKTWEYFVEQVKAMWGDEFEVLPLLTWTRIDPFLEDRKSVV